MTVKLLELLTYACKATNLERVDTVQEEFTLWYHPQFDVDRNGSSLLYNIIRSSVESGIIANVLEVGYPWGGRKYPGSKVMDLYDPRTDQIDYVMDACNMELESNIFDLVDCCSVLEHIPRFWLAASEMQRVLRPGGFIWVEVPSVWPFHPGGHNSLGDINYGGDYWRMNHMSLPVLFDQCEKIATWYIPALPRAGDDPRSGWGVVYLGRKFG